MSEFSPGEEVICVDANTEWPWKPCRFVKGKTYIVERVCTCVNHAVWICGYPGCWDDSRFRRPIVDESKIVTGVVEDA